jgi:hypothetical protein
MRMANYSAAEPFTTMARWLSIEYVNSSTEFFRPIFADRNLCGIGWKR